MDKTFHFLLLVVLWSADLIQCMNKLSTCPQNSISSGSADDICEPCWKRFEGKCYQVSQDAKIWESASESCNRLGANLIIIDSTEEQHFMKTLINQNISWIGLHYPDTTKLWQWVDGSNAILRLWSDGNPKFFPGERDLCAKTAENGKWSSERCRKLYQYVCEKDADECRNNNACTRNAECVNTNGSFSCNCITGFQTQSGRVASNSPQDSCLDKDECSATVCSENAECQNTIGSYYCTCSSGFKSLSGAVNFTGLQEKCKDNDECSVKNTCPDDAKCHNTIGSYQCMCEPGFQIVSRALSLSNTQKSCVDYDECSINDTCPNNAECHNTNGSYYCTCKPGFKSLSGAVTFTGSQDRCEDNDECIPSNTCPSNAKCQNTIGSYYCVCKPGFHSVSGAVNFTDQQETCEDNDECIPSNTCPSNAKCQNTIGSYYCTCKPGFHSVSGAVNFTDQQETCEDYDECSINNTCPNNAVCHNTNGSYYCTCKPGFILSGAITLTGSQDRCEDNDECTENNTCPTNAVCNNTIGSYYCTCKSGYNSLLRRADSTSLQYRCEGQTCHCCQRQKPNIPQCRTSNDIFVNSQIMVDILFTAGHDNNTSAMTQGKQQKEVTSQLQDVEKIVLDDVLSAMKSNGTQSETIFHKTNKTVIVARSVPVNSSELNETLVITADTTTMSIKTRIVIEGTEQGVLPVAVLISFHGYEIESILSHGNTSYKMNSKIITATISSKIKNDLNPPVIFTFLKNETTENEVETCICVFWKTDDTNKSYWSTDGCELSKQGNNRTHVTCECNHLSTFAVLLAHTDIDDKPLTIISFIGLTFSVICLILSIMTFRLCHSIQNASTTLLLNLCICLLIADGIFLFGISQTKYKILCKVISAFLHYSLLASFSWMCLGALQLHLMIQNLKAVKAFRTHVIRRRYMYPVGYGAPAIIVVTSVAVFPDGYGTDKICWLSLDRGFRWSFIGPVCFVILVNTILFTITIHILRKKFSALNKDVSTIKNTKILLFKATAQFLVLGCTWIFGIFHFQEETLVMSYLFTILNSFHGVFMFLLYCAANKLVIDEYKIWLQRLFIVKKKERELDTSTTMTTGIATAVASPSLPSTEDARALELIEMNPKTEDQDISKNL